MRGNDIEFLEAREDPAEAFEPSEQAFDFIAFFVQSAIVLPRREPRWTSAAPPEACPDPAPVGESHRLRRRAGLLPFPDLTIHRQAVQVTCRYASVDSWRGLQVLPRLHDDQLWRGNSALPLAN